MLALRFSGNLSQAQIAAQLGISQMQVSRLINRALVWLRAALLDDRPPPWLSRDSLGQPAVIRLWVTTSGRTVTVRVTGEVVRDTTDRLRHRLRSVVVSAAAGRLVIDLSAMPLADRATVALLHDVCLAAALVGVPVTLTGIRQYVAPRSPRPVWPFIKSTKDAAPALRLSGHRHFCQYRSTTGPRRMESAGSSPER